MTEIVGIISSFDINCGNATYSEYLAQGVEKRGYRVIRIAVPVTIQKENDSAAIDEIIRKIQSCSIVNVQMELGLYGSNPNSSSKNIVRIIKSLPQKTTFAVHRVEKKPKAFLRTMKTNLSKFSIIKALNNTIVDLIKSNYLYFAYKRIFNILNKKEFTVIAHTERDKRYLKKYYHIESITQPILWPDSLLTNTCKERDNSGVEIGIFGFISPHKNFNIVVEAFSHLLKLKKISKDSRLIIYGGHHPEAPGYGDKKLSFMTNNRILQHADKIDTLGPVEAISALIQIHKLQNVHWVVGGDDNEMANAIAQVDVCVIPYLETGQSGSGITSQSLQFARQIVMSDTKMTQQHQELCDGKIILFDTSSPVSLACAILRALEIKKTPRFKKIFTFDKTIDILIHNTDNQ